MRFFLLEHKVRLNSLVLFVASTSFGVIIVGCQTQPRLEPEDPPATTVQIQTYDADDYLQVFVNGTTRIVSTWPNKRDSGKVDISQWLVDGSNEIRLSAFNNGESSNPASFGFKVWVDGNQIADYQDTQSSIAPGLIFDKTIFIDAVGHSGGFTDLTVESAVDGAIYLDGRYTGHDSPAILHLPTGSHRLGIGASTNRYQEKQVVIEGATQAIFFEDSEWLPPRTWKLLLLSVRRMDLGSQGNNQIVTLSDNDIVVAYQHLDAVKKLWVEPFSFGLATWSVDQMVLEDTVGHVPDSGQKQIDSNRLLQDAVLEDLKNQYDCLVYFWPEVDDNGNDPLGCCLAVGGGAGISVPNSWIRHLDVFPNEVWLHEWLHVVEQYYFSKDFYNGSGGLHGAEEHGYSKINDSWLHWYRDFMQGKVVEGNFYVGIPPEAWINSSRINP